MKKLLLSIVLFYVALTVYGQDNNAVFNMLEGLTNNFPQQRMKLK